LIDGGVAAVHDEALLRPGRRERLVLLLRPVPVVEQVLDDALLDPGDGARGEAVGTNRRLPQDRIADVAANRHVLAEDLLTELRGPALGPAHEAAAFF